MRVLVIGGGAREHALVARLASDRDVGDLLAAPGNPGIASLARVARVSADDIDGLVSLARQWLVRSGLWRLLPAAVGGLLTLAAGLALLPALRHGLDFIKLKPLERLFVLMAFSSLLAISLTLILCVLWFRFLRRLRA